MADAISLGEGAEVMTGLVSLVACPIGLFVSESGTLCLKTEYGNNEGRIDAYIVSTGEFFWGTAPQTIANQRAQMVRPIDIDAAEIVCVLDSHVEFMEHIAVLEK